ncbi:glycosyltransferase family 4 protein [Psychromonas sp.]|nr:glycosyltransferase family 4 protein [Psychromonas sp.]
MEIELIVHETLPKRGGVATWVKMFIQGAKANLQQVQVISSAPCDIESAHLFLPRSFKNPIALVYIFKLWKYINQNHHRTFLVCDAGSIISVFIVSLLSKKDLKLALVFHGTEIQRLTKLFQKIGMRNSFSKFILSCKQVYISECVRKITHESQGCSDGMVVYNSFNISENIKELSYKAGVDVMKVIVVGRLDPRKRIDKLIKSLNLINCAMEIKIVGVGYNRLILKNLAARYAKSNDIIDFMGAVNDKELCDLYNSSDFVFVPSGRHKLAVEGFGLTVLEAISRGTIPIAIDIDGPGEIARSLTTPLVKNDVNSIAKFFNESYENGGLDINTSNLNRFTPSFQFKSISAFLNE